jgi:hypothetical protein
MLIPREYEELGETFLDIDRRLKLLEAQGRTSKRAGTSRAPGALRQITPEMIPDKSIGSRQLQYTAIGTNHLRALAVNQEKLAESAVITSKLADAAVDTDKLANLATTAAKLAANSVEDTKLAGSENLLTNPGFETGDFTGWTQGSSTLDSGVYHGGAYSSKVEASGGNTFGAVQYIAIDPTKKYKLVGWNKISALATGDCYFNHKECDSGFSVLHHWSTVYSSTMDWTKVEITFGPAGSGADYEWSASAAYIQIQHSFYNGSGNPSGTAYMDDIDFFLAEDTEDPLRIEEAHIRWAAIGGAAIAYAAIGSAHIDTGIIQTAHIASAAITDAKVSDISADKITTGTIRSINSFAAAYATVGSYLTSAYPYVVDSDSFTDSDSTPLENHSSSGANSWVEHPSSSNTSYIKSNRIYGISSLYYLDTDPSTDNKYRVKADFYVVTNPGAGYGYQTAVVGRMSASTDTGYHARYNFDTGKWELVKYVSGTPTVLGSYTQSLTVGHTYEVELRISDSSKELWVDGVQRVTDTDNTITAEGYAGVHFISTSTAAIHLDNFQVLGPVDILHIEDTSDFSSSGSGWFVDSTNDRDAFSWTGKTSTTLTGCSGVLSHNAGTLVIPASKSIVISDAVNEMRFFGDRGDGTVEELANIGKKPSGGDYIIGYFGSSNLSSGIYAVYAESTGAFARLGAGGIGAYASGVNYGLICEQSAAATGGPLLIIASTSASAPTHAAQKGTLWVTSGGVLYINKGGTTWQKVGAQ